MAIRKLNRIGVKAANVLTTPQINGETHTALITHQVSEDIGTGDILELAAIPADMKIVQATIATENLPAANLTVGIMSGRLDSTDAARTSGNELFNAAPAGTEASTGLVALAGIARDSGNRAIGLRTSAAIPAAGNRRIHLRLTFAAQPTLGSA